MPTPTPGVYRKGQSVRTADTAAEAVALTFDGYAKQTAESVAADSDYRDLQTQAKELGIPANQSKEALAKAIADHVPGDEVPSAGSRQAPETSYVSALGDGTDEDADSTDS